jgi:hypothetical protein
MGIYMKQALTDKGNYSFLSFQITDCIYKNPGPLDILATEPIIRY